MPSRRLVTRATSVTAYSAQSCEESVKGGRELGIARVSAKLRAVPEADHQGHFCHREPARTAAKDGERDKFGSWQRC